MMAITTSNSINVNASRVGRTGGSSRKGHRRRSCESCPRHDAGLDLRFSMDFHKEIVKGLLSNWGYMPGPPPIDGPPLKPLGTPLGFVDLAGGLFKSSLGYS